MSADSPTAQDTDTVAERSEHASSQESAPEQVDSVQDSGSDPSYGELRDLADQQEEQLAASDNESVDGYGEADARPAEPDTADTGEDGDPTPAELRALAEQQDADLAADAPEAAAEGEDPSADDAPVEDEPREAVTDGDGELTHEESRALPDEQGADLAAETESGSDEPESRIEAPESDIGSADEAIDEDPDEFVEHEQADLGEQAAEEVEQPAEPDAPQEAGARDPDIDDDPTYEELRALAEQQDAELAADAEGPTSPDSSNWAEHKAQSEQAWQEHEARWPQESETAQVDRAGDEPGSWRGDGGQYLNVEENLVTGHHHERVAEARPEVTGAIESIGSEVSGAELVGLEYQLKGPDRYKEKVAEGLADMPERAVEQITAQVPDALRYTYQFAKNDYTDGYRDVCRRLEDRGYQMELSRNSWDNQEYKGINSRWRTEDGQMFEVQFHTPESFEAKQLTHGAYERARNPRTGDLEAGEISAFQTEVSRHIPVPDLVEEIDNYKRKRG